jgi:RimJ/RimL family protein N-acetyltransferase
MFADLRLEEVPDSDEPLAGVAADELVGSIVAAMNGVYRRSGFIRPWIGYIAVSQGQPIGACGFKSPPCENRVEIAYGTFGDFQGRGVATAMAKELLRIAKQEEPGIVVTAQTLPGPGASASILTKLGFHCRGPVEHPEDGTVWDWELAPE